MTRFYDNQRISTFRTCHMKYYFRHVRHWAPNSTDTALAFGLAWHSAMEVVWPMLIKGRADDEIMLTAFVAWEQTWTECGFPAANRMDYETEKDLAPRTPGRAYEMLADYLGSRRPKVKDLELIAVEKPLIVPLDPNDDTLFYVGKLDKVVREKRSGKYRSVEHKTTTLNKSGGGFRPMWIDSFSPNSQVDGYIYALHMMFPGKVGGAWIDGALVHGSNTDFMFIPVEKPRHALDRWLWETRYWIDQIELHTKALTGSADDPYMAAFPRDTGSCQNFMKNCEYIDACRASSNPERITEPPAGFHVEEWNPLDHIPGLKAEIEGTKK